PQVSLTRDYLLALTTLNYTAAYELLAPSIRGSIDQTQFIAARRAEGVLGQPAVWPDDETTTRAEYVLGRPGESTSAQRHRFLLKREDGRWWMDHEVASAAGQSIAPSLKAAMQQFVLQRAGKLWAGSVELLRQEGFEGGQLLLFSYIEPHPPASLTQQ